MWREDERHYWLMALQRLRRIPVGQASTARSVGERGNWPDGEVSGIKCVHPSLFLLLWYHILTRSTFGEKQVYLPYDSRLWPIISGESRWELESASHLIANSSDGEKMNACMLPASMCLAACVLSSTVQDRPAQGMTLPTVGWAFPYQCL